METHEQKTEPNIPICKNVEEISITIEVLQKKQNEKTKL